MLVGRWSARSCSGRSTLRGIVTTFSTAPPERNGGRVARARAAAAAERRAAALRRLSTLRRRSRTTVGWPERAEYQLLGQHHHIFTDESLEINLLILYH